MSEQQEAAADRELGEMADVRTVGLGPPPSDDDIRAVDFASQR